MALGLACLGVALIAAIGAACAPSADLSSPRVTPPPEPTSLAVIEAEPTLPALPSASPIAVLKNGVNRRGGQAFVNYALSRPAQDILSRYGFARVVSGTAHAAR